MMHEVLEPSGKIIQSDAAQVLAAVLGEPADLVAFEIRDCKNPGIYDVGRVLRKPVKPASLSGRNPGVLSVFARSAENSASYILRTSSGRLVYVIWGVPVAGGFSERDRVCGMIDLADEEVEFSPFVERRASKRVGKIRPPARKADRGKPVFRSDPEAERGLERANSWLMERGKRK